MGKRAEADHHASAQAYIEYMRPRCVQLARVPKKTGSFYYHFDSNAPQCLKGSFKGRSAEFLTTRSAY